MADAELPNVAELEEMKEDDFTRAVALVTAFFAVILAITSLGGNNAGKEMMLSQQQASNQWAYYQAKVIREHIYKTEKMTTEVALAERGAAMTVEARGNYEALVKKLGEEAERYSVEKKDVEKQAKELEAARDLNMKKDPYFDFAEVLLQIAIVMASISILAHSRQVFYLSVVMASIGAFLSFNGFTLMFAVPFLS